MLYWPWAVMLHHERNRLLFFLFGFECFYKSYRIAIAPITSVLLCESRRCCCAAYISWLPSYNVILFFLSFISFFRRSTTHNVLEIMIENGHRSYMWPIDGLCLFIADVNEECDRLAIRLDSRWHFHGYYQVKRTVIDVMSHFHAHSSVAPSLLNIRAC